MATIQDIRIELGDTDTTFPLMSDSEITYFLTKNDSNLQRTCLDCAKSLLFKLAIRSEDSSVDIFSVKGSKAQAAYMESLKLYIKNPEFNSVLNLASGYAGGISKSDMLANNSTLDNNSVITPGMDFSTSASAPNPFTI